MNTFFNLYIKYFTGVSYTIIGLVSWIMGFNHGFHLENILLISIGAFVTPYGVYNLVDAILYHIKLKERTKQFKI